MDKQIPPAGNEAQFSELVGGVTRLEASFSDHSFERHSHDCFSIGMTTYGIQSFRCKRQKYNSRAGDLVIFNPDEDHDGSRGTADGFRYTMLHIPTALVESCVDKEAGSGRISYFATSHSSDPAMAAMFRTVCRELAYAPSESLRAESVTRGFLGRMLAWYGEKSGPRDTPSRRVGIENLLRVNNYIKSNFQRDITVAELAGVAGLSSAHFSRAFQAHFNMPPHVLLNAVRIEHARNLIRLGMPLADVAGECGFADQSHLTRRFKGSVGAPPSAWREMICQKGRNL